MFGKRSMFNPELVTNPLFYFVKFFPNETVKLSGSFLIGLRPIYL